jgi:hypothetical protein
MILDASPIERGEKRKGMKNILKIITEQGLIIPTEFVCVFD